MPSLKYTPPGDDAPPPVFNPVDYYRARPITILEEKQRNLVRCSVTIIKRKYPFLLP